uniref:UDP-glycosyltransferase 85C1-like n=1 Tax=Erigeron canadensis TaxID=72917 RepID=UPI001CB93CA7|nr:UDP-glycosyltransferase 85C1-like [Erigeron canadensis]
MNTMTRVVEKQPHVVFIPFPAQSHIKCMLKLAKLLHHKGIHITFINTRSNHKKLVESGGAHDFKDIPGFQFRTVSDYPSSGAEDDGVEPMTPTLAEVWMYLADNFFDSFLDIVSGLESTPATCIICDGFMTYTNMITAAEKLKIPIILFWTMAACGFMGFYQVKVLTDKGLLPLKDESYLTNGYLEMEIDWIPGMEGCRLKDLPQYMLVTKLDDPIFKYHYGTAQAAHNVSYMIIHTFEELEARLVNEIKYTFPNVYTVGPLQLLLNQIEEKENKRTGLNCYSLWKEEPECLQWLESKEPGSVVYVNFGSLAVMSLEDLTEFGWGLVNSNHEFLWIIRTDLVKEQPVVWPQELEEEMRTKGFLAKWCSQEEVLSHPSVGGFLTHGGWGSIIESLSAGLPMICWPYSGDQRTNCRQMCNHWDVGMEIGRSVKRDEVEKLVKLLMDGLEGKRMKEKAMQWKKMAEMATSSNGSSSLDIEKLANQIINFS